ncbi:MAG: glycosyltransferase [Neptuniibacter caesariensis]|uniref:Glycosyltransferase n=1 Tax=Neptuniibacter caesariensis TaxID=207954 RepID=A0A2G6JN58_NEPCE|nr:MAG: glycosyltransferase [Neptuniibacter caesariensis]
MFNRLDLVIINRSFWPIYPVIGEALMRFSEEQAVDKRVGVILQDHANIKKKLFTEKRGEGVDFYPCYAFSISGSSVFRRGVDAVFFMLWVFAVLTIKRPKKVYVSTDPPVVVPFIVMIYSIIFRAEYIYHLQDIHPEATNVVIPIRPWLFRLLKWLDSITMRHADIIITITQEMEDEILNRSHTRAPIETIFNPSVSFDEVSVPENKIEGFVFCGNAGRLQRIPLLIEAIDQYYIKGGSLPFVFAGAGVYEQDIKELSERHEYVDYRGFISASDAAQLNASYSWAILPIEDEVTRYAFPSKSSSYVFSGAKILAICGESTSVASWVVDNKLGVVVAPDVNAICECFVSIEKRASEGDGFDDERQALKEQLSFDAFVNHLTNLVAGARK